MTQTGLNTGTPADTDVNESVEQTAEPEVSTEESAQRAEEGVTEEAKETGAEQTPQPRKKTAQERIDEITFARREAERQAEYWRNEALRVQAQAKPAETQPPVMPSDRPKLENFQTTEAYEDALMDWKFNKQAEQTRQVEAQKAQEKAIKDFNEKVQKLKTEYPDLEDVIQSPVFTPVMEHAIYSVSDNGALLAYHLALPENRQVVDAMAKLPRDKQLAELGKFEANMLLNKATKKHTSAPAPIKPVGAPAGGETAIDTGKMSDEEYFAWDEKMKREAFMKARKV